MLGTEMGVCSHLFSEVSFEAYKEKVKTELRGVLIEKSPECSGQKQTESKEGNKGAKSLEMSHINVASWDDLKSHNCQCYQMPERGQEGDIFQVRRKLTKSSQ